MTFSLVGRSIGLSPCTWAFGMILAPFGETGWGMGEGVCFADLSCYLEAKLVNLIVGNGSCGCFSVLRSLRIRIFVGDLSGARG